MKMFSRERVDITKDMTRGITRDITGGITKGITRHITKGIAGNRQGVPPALAEEGSLR
jgi:hypothetical protein